MFIYPYKQGSESAKLLAKELGAKRIMLEGSKFKGSPDKVVINWGSSSLSDEALKCKVVNKPESVSVAADKLAFFKTVSDVSRVPKWTTNRIEAIAWNVDGHIILARHKLTGNSGEGIEVIDYGEMPDAPLYVQYVPKKQEYRVHVFNGEVVDVQRKARRKDVPDEAINWRIRNHDNGFIFARGEALGEVPDDVLVQAVNAVKACGLDFGAADVIYNDKQQLAFVLEVNTAPGLSGATLTGYVERLAKLG